MTTSFSLRAAVAAGLIGALAAANAGHALEFGTVIFSDDFEGFSAGQTISAGVNDAPSSGVGLLWQYIGTPGQEAEVSNAFSFGPGTKSLEVARPFLGLTPRYFTYPAVIPESDMTANSTFGVQYDVYLPQNPHSTEEPFVGLSGIANGIAPGGSPINAATLLSYGDGAVRTWDGVEGTYVVTDFSFGEGWQTIEVTHEIGADLGNGTAENVITHFLTRHDGNLAGTLARTQIYQVTETVPLGGNFRLDINNSGPGVYYLDNVVVGRLDVGSGVDGDFDGDDDVDGNDFLVWQRGELPNPLSSDDLDDWKLNFGTVPPPAQTAAAAVPEPSSLLMLLMGLAASGASIRKSMRT